MKKARSLSGRAFLLPIHPTRKYFMCRYLNPLYPNSYKNKRCTGSKSLLLLPHHRSGSHYSGLVYSCPTNCLVTCPRNAPPAESLNSATFPACLRAGEHKAKSGHGFGSRISAADSASIKLYFTIDAIHRDVGPHASGLAMCRPSFWRMLKHNRKVSRGRWDRCNRRRRVMTRTAK